MVVLLFVCLLADRGVTLGLGTQWRRALYDHPIASLPQWRFSFSHFVVDPGQEYEVTVHHLPKPIPDGDPNHKSKIIFVPGKCPSKQPLGTGLWVKQQGLKQQRLSLLHSGCRRRGCCASSRGLYVSKAICPLLYGETPECVGKKILSICAEK